MHNCVILEGSNVTEEIKGARFASLENEVKHVVSDISEIKENQKETTKAITVMSESLIKLAMIANQSEKSEPRLKALEDKVQGIILKITAASAFASGAWWVIGDAVSSIIKQ